MGKSKSVLNHTLAIVKAGISLVPYIGGSIAGLMSDYIPDATERSRNEALNYLKIDLEKLQERIDVESINKDEFSELYKSCYLTMTRTHKQEKLRATASIITNILLKEGDPNKLSFNELDHYTRCIDSLSIGAIEIVGIIYNNKKIKEGVQEKRFHNFDFSLLQRLKPDIEPSFLMGLLCELNSFNLVHMRGVPEFRKVNFSNYQFVATVLGATFVEYILQLPES